MVDGILSGYNTGTNVYTKFSHRCPREQEMSRDNIIMGMLTKCWCKYG